MCGILGVISKNPFDEKIATLIQNSMKDIEFRGTDAFGYVTLENKTKEKSGILVSKVVGKVSDYITSENKQKKNDIINDSKNKFVFLGHTRASTGGKAESVNSQGEPFNNHPFITKDFIMAHNGTISNSLEIRKDFKIESDIETDSFVIIYLIQHFYDNIKEFKDESDRIKKAIERTTNVICGGYSCWLLHIPSRKIFLFKSKHSDLEMSYSKKLDLLLFASDSKYYKEFIKPLFQDETPKDLFESLFGTDDLKTLDFDSKAGIIEINYMDNSIKFDEKEWIRSYYSNSYKSNTNSYCSGDYDYDEYYGAYNLNKDNKKEDKKESDEVIEMRKNLSEMFVPLKDKKKLTKQEIDTITANMDWDLLKLLGIYDYLLDIHKNKQDIIFFINPSLTPGLDRYGVKLDEKESAISIDINQLDKFIIIMEKAFIFCYPLDAFSKQLVLDLNEDGDHEYELDTTKDQIIDKQPNKQSSDFFGKVDTNVLDASIEVIVEDEVENEINNILD